MNQVQNLGTKIEFWKLKDQDRTEQSSKFCDQNRTFKSLETKITQSWKFNDQNAI